ncbi:hypothetical protein [Roseateles sp.]|uniref:hypothetical protein n=1 Tax=Roseateles sp. TaxID=1971397 RepID=UPI00391BB58F
MGGTGPAHGAANAPLDLDALMLSEDDSQLDAAMARVSGVLMRHLADKLSSASLGSGHAVLRLHFDH